MGAKRNERFNARRMLFRERQFPKAKMEFGDDTDGEGGQVHILEKMKTAEQLRDEFTLSKPCCVDGTPDAQTVWLKIGVQSFCLDGYQDTKEEADWMRLTLGKALKNLIEQEIKTTTKKGRAEHGKESEAK